MSDLVSAELERPATPGKGREKIHQVVLRPDPLAEVFCPRRCSA